MAVLFLCIAFFLRTVAADPADSSRAPAGQIAATVSTHTDYAPWLEWGNENREKYRQMREQYTQKIISAIEAFFPGFRRAITLCLPGTPATFVRFTGRGMVGGFPQTSIFQSKGPRTGIENIMFVGDTIFPGQSTAATTLGAMRVAKMVEKFYRVR